MSILPSGSSLTSFFSIERVVAFLTPVLFAPLATWIAAIIAANVPFAKGLDSGTLEGIEIAAFVSTCAVAIKWLHGRQIPAVAGLTPPIPLSPADLSTFYTQTQAYLAAHPETFQGAPGVPGASVTQEAIDAAAAGAVKRLLGTLGGAAPATPVV